MLWTTNEWKNKFIGIVELTNTLWIWELRVCFIEDFLPILSKLLVFLIKKTKALVNVCRQLRLEFQCKSHFMADWNDRRINVISWLLVFIVEFVGKNYVWRAIIFNVKDKSLWKFSTLAKNENSFWLKNENFFCPGSF